MTSFPRCALVTNLCPDYRKPIFDMLSKRLGVDIYLTGSGSRYYWNPQRVRADADPKRPTGQIGILRQVQSRIAQNRYDVVIKCINGTVALPAVFLAAKRARKPFVLWTGLWRHPRTLRHLIGYPLTKYIYSASDAICVYGSHVKHYLVSKGVEANRIVIVGQSARPLPASDGTPGKFAAPYFLFVGRLVPEKGVRFLLSALGLMEAPIHLIIVGHGPEEGGLRRFVASLGPGITVTFAGTATGADLARYYRNALAVVVPSITTRTFREPWGLVINEAMSCRIPVITSDSVGAAAGGLVEDRVSGLVVPEREPGLLAGAMSRIRSDAELRDRLASEGQRRVELMNYETMFRGFKKAILKSLGRSADGNHAYPDCA